MKSGVRGEGEQWVQRKQVSIVGLQETGSRHNTKQSRNQSTWPFNGEGSREGFTAGVAVVISNSFLQYAQDIEPVSDRLMYVTLGGTINATIIIITYLPTADRPDT